MVSLPAFPENGSARTQTQSGSNPAGIEPEPLEDRGQLDSRLSSKGCDLLDSRAFARGCYPSISAPQWGHALSSCETSRPHSEQTNSALSSEPFSRVVN